jgi:hypothetical protein
MERTWKYLITIQPLEVEIFREKGICCENRLNGIFPIVAASANSIVACHGRYWAFCLDELFR